MGFPGGISGKEPTCQCRRREMQIWSLGQEDALVESMATHSSILAWRIAWIEEPGGLQFIGSQRVGHDWSDLVCTQEGNTRPCHRVSGVGWKIILLTSVYLTHTALICSINESGWSGVVSSVCQQYLCSAFVYNHLSIIKLALCYNHL